MLTSAQPEMAQLIGSLNGLVNAFPSLIDRTSALSEYGGGIVDVGIGTGLVSRWRGNKSKREGIGVGQPQLAE